MAPVKAGLGSPVMRSGVMRILVYQIALVLMALQGHAVSLATGSVDERFLSSNSLTDLTDQSILTIKSLSANFADRPIDNIFGEQPSPRHNSSKRAAWDMYAMVKCSTGCNPLVFKGYGCYCGFLGSGQTVDGIDRCCKMHDWCYTTTSCMFLQYNLPYFVPYKWKCNGGAPYCIAGKTSSTGPGSCSHQLCECDREFVHCLADFPCPKKKAMCRSPWRYFQNLFMGLGTGMEMEDMEHHSLHGHPHPAKPSPLVSSPGPIFTRNRLNIELG